MSYLTRLALRNVRADGIDPVHAERLYWMVAKWEREHGESPLNATNAARLEELRGRARLREAITEHAEDGFLYVGVHSMDCDCAVSTRKVMIPANKEAVTSWLDGLYADAEGPVSWRWLTRAEFFGFVPENRDLALEAHEDGHPHVVYA